MDKLRFQSLGSGSSGNCYFLGNASYGILIDGGIGVRTIRKNLKSIGLDFQNIWAVFVTHDHADHIRAIGSIGERYKVPIYATRKTHEGIRSSYCVTEKLYDSKKFIEKHETVIIGDFSITAFPVSHDATDNVGYKVVYKEKTFTFATDLGHICENAHYHLKSADYMVLEANYDEDMLRNGQYPIHLQERIRGENGHLSNDQTGKFLAENYQQKMKYVFLCHLSRENNKPEIAYSTIQSYLENKDVRVGEDLQLIVLERFTPSKVYVFE
jgi:phosphoribosyl 1,2-cyclic phosphodiesterase